MIIHLLAPKNQHKWSEIWKHCYNIWKSSSHEIKMWYDEDIDKLLKEDDKEFFNTLSKFPPIYKFDYVRYLILEKFGGAYFDMDVEVINDSFLNVLNPHKSYFMEGTGGSYLDNSIMISPILNSNNHQIWTKLKNFTKNRVNLNIEDCLIPLNTLHKVGPYALSDFIIKHLPRGFSSLGMIYDILGTHQFSSLTSEISFCRHYHTSVWNRPN